MPTRRQVLTAGATTAAATAVTTGTAAATPANPNIALIQRYYAAYAAGDLTALRRFLHRDIRWTIPGHHPLAGTKHGVDEVLAFFAALGRAGFRAELHALAADGDWVLDLHRGWSTTPEGLDSTWVLAFRVQGRRIVEAINFAADQHAADAYFWRTFPLAPLPGRFE